MKTCLISIALASATVFLPQAANATISKMTVGVTSNLAFKTTTDTFLGQIVTPNNGSATIIRLTGTFNGFNIAGLSPYASADNQFYSTSPYASYSGISFTANSIDYNLYSNSGLFLTNSITDPSGFGAGALPIIMLKTGPVPEAATFGLMLAGVSLLGALLSLRNHSRP